MTVDGVWLGWSDWSQCNVTCGGGKQERVRECEEPRFDGKPCQGSPTDYIECSTNMCPSKYQS